MPRMKQQGQYKRDAEDGEGNGNSIFSPSHMYLFWPRCKQMLRSLAKHLPMISNVDTFCWWISIDPPTYCRDENGLHVWSVRQAWWWMWVHCFARTPQMFCLSSVSIPACFHHRGVMLPTPWALASYIYTRHAKLLLNSNLWPTQHLVVAHIHLKDNRGLCVVLNISFLTKPIIHSGYNANTPESPRIVLQWCWQTYYTFVKLSMTIGFAC